MFGFFHKEDILAYIQSKFLQFHDAIKLRHFNENETLREKRDIIRRKISDRLSDVFEQEGIDCPSYKFEDQGSYSFGTGIKPLDGDFDIDQGLYFDTPISRWPDPVQLKELVFKTVENHTRKVSVRRSCITVFYSIDDEPCYHVDVAIYSKSKSNPGGMAHIAKGKLNSSPFNRFWEMSDQACLEDMIKNKHFGEDAAQFRRVVRYLKRWKDYQKSKSELASITGIALTILVYNHFTPQYKDYFSKSQDDLLALKSTLDNYVSMLRTGTNEIFLPVAPYNNLLEKLTEKQLQEFEKKTFELQRSLEKAYQDADPIRSCLELREMFGDDFPETTLEESARKNTPAITHSGQSAEEII